MKNDQPHVVGVNQAADTVYERVAVSAYYVHQNLNADERTFRDVLDDECGTVGGLYRASEEI